MRTDPASYSVSKIAGLTLVNALVFQEVLADYESQVQHLRQTLQASDAISAFADHWEYILTQINYLPMRIPRKTIPCKKIHSWRTTISKIIRSWAPKIIAFRGSLLYSMWRTS